MGRNNGYTYLCTIKYKKSEASIERGARIAGGSEFNGAGSLLSKIGFSTQRRKGRRESNLFGGEPLDKLKALSKAEGRPPNKRASVTLG